MLERLAHFVVRRRKLVVLAWIAPTLLGAYSAKAVSNRWLDRFSVPGYSAYETNQRTLKIFGSGEQPPHVALFTLQEGDITQDKRIGAGFPAWRCTSPAATRSRTRKGRRAGRAS